MWDNTVNNFTAKPDWMPLTDTQLMGAASGSVVPETPNMMGNNGSAALIAPVALPDSPETKKKAKKAGKHEKGQKQGVAVPGKAALKSDELKAYMTQEKCRQLCLSIFFREQTSVRSLGFTSSVSGEGKSFLSTISAISLASDSGIPVTLLECNWEHPGVHDYFGIAPSPGLAEYLRGEVNDWAIRRPVSSNLTVIPAGNGRRDAVTLLQRLRKNGSLNALRQANELLIVDLPPVLTTAYGALMASLVDALLVVVHAHVTSERLIAETCSQLNSLPIEGLLLNQVESHIPRWLQRLL